MPFNWSTGQDVQGPTQNSSSKSRNVSAIIKDKDSPGYTTLTDVSPEQVKKVANETGGTVVKTYNGTPDASQVNQDIENDMGTIRRGNGGSTTYSKAKYPEVASGEVSPLKVVVDNLNQKIESGNISKAQIEKGEKSLWIDEQGKPAIVKGTNGPYGMSSQAAINKGYLKINPNEVTESANGDIDINVSPDRRFVPDSGAVLDTYEGQSITRAEADRRAKESLQIGSSMLINSFQDKKDNGINKGAEGLAGNAGDYGFGRSSGSPYNVLKGNNKSGSNDVATVATDVLVRPTEVSSESKQTSKENEWSAQNLGGIFLEQFIASPARGVAKQVVSADAMLNPIRERVYGHIPGYKEYVLEPSKKLAEPFTIKDAGTFISDPDVQSATLAESFIGAGVVVPKVAQGAYIGTTLFQGVTTAQNPTPENVIGLTGLVALPVAGKAASKVASVLPHNEASLTGRFMQSSSREAKISSGTSGIAEAPKLSTEGSRFDNSLFTPEQQVQQNVLRQQPLIREATTAQLKSIPTIEVYTQKGYGKAKSEGTDFSNMVFNGEKLSPLRHEPINLKEETVNQFIDLNKPGESKVQKITPPIEIMTDVKPSKPQVINLEPMIRDLAPDNTGVARNPTLKLMETGRYERIVGKRNPSKEEYAILKNGKYYYTEVLKNPNDSSLSNYQISLINKNKATPIAKGTARTEDISDLISSSKPLREKRISSESISVEKVNSSKHPKIFTSKDLFKPDAEVTKNSRVNKSGSGTVQIMKEPQTKTAMKTKTVSRELGLERETVKTSRSQEQIFKSEYQSKAQTFKSYPRIVSQTDKSSYGNALMPATKKGSGIKIIETSKGKSTSKGVELSKSIGLSHSSKLAFRQTLAHKQTTDQATQLINSQDTLRDAGLISLTSQISRGGRGNLALPKLGGSDYSRGSGISTRVAARENRMADPYSFLVGGRSASSSRAKPTRMQKPINLFSHGKKAKVKQQKWL